MSIRKATGVLIAAMAWMPVSALAASFTITPYSVPGSTYTNLTGINNSGVVAGSYGLPEDSHQYAFTASGATVTTINAIPTAMVQWANSVSNDGRVAGVYQEDGNNFAFSVAGNTVTPLTYPGATGLTAYGINSSGKVVGQGSTESAAFSFFYDGASASAFSVPGAVGTYAYGINDSDTVVGSYYDSNFLLHGFTWNGTTFTTIDIDGAVNGTTINSISNNGKMAGSWVDAQSSSHGWIWDGVTFTTVDSGSIAAAVYGVALNGINDSGQFVGYYTDANFNQPSFIGQLSDAPTAAPEPGTAVLLLGAFALAGAGRKILRRS